MRHGRLIGVLGAAFLAASGATQIAIEAVAPNRTEAPLYARIELAVALKTAAANPFDADDVALEAHIATPSGKAVIVPGFYTREFGRSLVGGKETLAPTGEPRWMVRFALAERGTHQVIVTAKDRTGEAKSQPIVIVAGEPEGDGFVRASVRDPRYLEFDSGKAFWPLGMNLGWAGPEGLYDYDRWIPALAASRGSLVRVFLDPEGATFALQSRAHGGLDRIALPNAWRLEYLLNLLEKHGLHAILVIESHENLRDRGTGARWDQSPHKRDNGGPLDTPRQFWDEPAMERMFRNKLRYLVARYGAFKSVLAWELFNEPDQTRGFDASRVRAWHDRTAEHLASIDPYRHLVTSSFSPPMGMKEIDNLPSIGLAQTHLYGASDVAATVALLHHKRLGYGKPHVPTVVAANRTVDRASEDVKGLFVHNAIWASIGAGASGAAMPWWWQNAMARGLHRRFAPAARFLEGVDWPGERMRPVSANFAFQKPPSTPFYRDLVIAGGPESFGNTEYNLPRLVRIDTKRVRYGLPISGILHGRRNYPSKHNPVTMRIDLARPTTLDVHIGDVSGQGGARLKITVDGRVALDRNFPDPNDVGEPAVQDQFRSSHAIALAPGTRTLRIENVGNDWLKASFAFRDLFVRPLPPLTGLATLGDNTGLVWVRHADRNWHRVVEQKRPFAACPPTTMRIAGLRPGTWRAELWDTSRGVVSKSQSVQVGVEGIAEVRLPEIASDLAVKLKRVQPGKK